MPDLDREHRKSLRRPARATLAVSFLAAALATPEARAQTLEPTPPQIEGPYYPRTKPAEADADLTRLAGGPAAQGEVLELSGTVVDPAGKPIAGARVEIWQTDRNGIYDHPGDSGRPRRDAAFQGYGAVTTADAGVFAFRTIMPGRYGGRPRHIHVKVTPLVGPALTTQLYFHGDPELRTDGIAAGLGKRLARVTLAPVQAAGESGPSRAEVTLVLPRGR